MKSSLQRELDQFYKELTQSDFQIRQISKSAFTQSRAKLRPEAFLELNDVVQKGFYEETNYLGWKGKRILSCDGSRLMLPKHETVIDEFGQVGFGPKADSLRSLATISLLYDPLNLVTLDAQMTSYDGSERALLQNHLPCLNKGDILLLDRGYPSIALFYQLQEMGVDYCVRMKDNWWLEVKKFSESGERERLVKFLLPKKDQRVFQDNPGIAEKPIECRLVKVDLPNGESEILCTSLLDAEKDSHQDIADLYQVRWGVEEQYKLLKARAELEFFSGKTAIAVKQDFFAKVFIMTMSAIMSFPINEKVIEETMNDPDVIHVRKINRTAALSWTQASTIALFLKAKANEALIAFDSVLFKTTEIIRPGRHNPRKKRPKALHYMNYKRL